MPRAKRTYGADALAPSVIPPATRYVHSGDARIAYRTLGRGGRSVVVLQPFWMSMDDILAGQQGFIRQIAEWQRAVLHDRRGTGGSDRHPANISVDAMVDDLMAVMTDAGIKSAALLASGESGPLAVRAAAARPDRISRVVLVDPILRSLKGPGSAMLIHALNRGPRAGLRALARTLVDNDVQAAELGAQMARTVDGPTAARLYEAFLDTDSFSVLHQVTMPVLLAYGVFDRVTSDGEARNVQAALPDARMGIVNGAAGGDATVREAWIQIRDFLSGEAPKSQPAESPDSYDRRVSDRDGESDNGEGDPSQRAVRHRVQTKNQRSLVDYVPSSPQPHVAPASLGAITQNVPPPPGLLTPNVVPASVVGGHSPARPIMMTWGPPPNIPDEAVRLNRQGIDQLLIGEIEKALVLFQQALDLAPHYEDAAINHRELLSRLVQKRVADWQNRQADEILADSERRAARHAKPGGRKRRGPLARLIKPTAKAS